MLITLVNRLNDRANVKICQARNHVLYRSISEGNKFTEQVWRRNKAVDTPTGTANDPREVKSKQQQQQQQPVTTFVLKDIARLHRRRSTIRTNDPPTSTDNSATTKNQLTSSIKESHQSSKRPSFFREPQQAEQENFGEVASGHTSKLSESLTKLLIKPAGNAGSHPPIPLHSEKSIFDVFQVPEAPQMQISQHDKRSPNAYSLDAVKQYYEILEPIVKSDKFFSRVKEVQSNEVQSVLEWLKADEPILGHDLPTFHAAIKSELDLTKENATYKKNLQKELSEQHARFCNHYNLTEMKHIDLAFKGLLIATSMCARYGKGLPVEVIWGKIKESGAYQKELLQHLLYVSATFTTGSARSRRKRRSKYGHLAGIASILDVLDSDEFTSTAENDQAKEETDLVDTTDEIAIFHDILFEPSEQSINIRVKLLVAQGKAKEAEMLLDEHSSGAADLRLRAYNPVLKLFIELNDLSSALRLFRKMKNIPTVHLDADAYMHLIAGFAEKGAFCIGAESIESAIELGYTSTSGPGLFDELVEEMAGAIYEIPAASAKRLYNAMASGFAGSELNETAIHSLKINTARAQSNELLASRVLIDPREGVCPRSGVKLRLIQLSEDDKRKLVDQVLQKASLEQYRAPESKSGLTIRKDVNPLLNFYNWLDQREGRPFTVLVDGANVAYNHQNTEQGRFSYHQIQFMVDFLERMGENPLVILPQKYSYKSFYISMAAPGYFHGAKQFLTRDELHIRDILSRFGKVFYVPTGTLGE